MKNNRGNVPRFKGIFPIFGGTNHQFGQQL
jgi:hypothetical protein